MTTQTATRWRDVAEVVRTLLGRTGKTQGDLARAIGLADATAVSKALITQDGEVVANASSSGAFVIATCSD